MEFSKLHEITSLFSTHHITSVYNYLKQRYIDIFASMSLSKVLAPPYFFADTVIVRKLIPCTWTETVWETLQTEVRGRSPAGSWSRSSTRTAHTDPDMAPCALVYLRESPPGHRGNPPPRQWGHRRCSACTWNPTVSRLFHYFHLNSISKLHTGVIVGVIIAFIYNFNFSPTSGTDSNRLVYVFCFL